jgi:hypothetical protein
MGRAKDLWQLKQITFSTGELWGEERVRERCSNMVTGLLQLHFDNRSTNQVGGASQWKAIKGDGKGDR